MQELGPAGRLWAGYGPTGGPLVPTNIGLRVYEADTPVLRLNPDTPSSSMAPPMAFDVSGRHLLFGSTPGPVIDCDLPALRAELGKLGLDWTSPPPEAEDSGESRDRSRRESCSSP